jgi:hypothetical protein
MRVSYLADIERGHRTPAPGHLLAELGRALGIDYDYLC